MLQSCRPVPSESERLKWAANHRKYEPPHDKTNNVAVRPAKTQISLGIRPVWSESALCAQWVAKDPSFLHVDSEDYDQTGRMPRLIWDFAGRTATLLVLSWGGSYKTWTATQTRTRAFWSRMLSLPPRPTSSDKTRNCRKCIVTQLYRHLKVGNGPVDIRTAQSKAVFLGRQPFNAIPAPSTAQVWILVLPRVLYRIGYVLYSICYLGIWQIKKATVQR